MKANGIKINVYRKIIFLAITIYSLQTKAQLVIPGNPSTNVTDQSIEVHHASSIAPHRIYIGHGGANYYLNTAVGEGSLASLIHVGVGPYGNSGFGYMTLNRNLIGKGNTAIGTQCLELVYGNSNVGVGYQTLRGRYTTIGGVDSAWSNLATGNTGLGQGALTAIQDGFYNSALGYNSLVSLHNGNYNVGIGYGASVVEGADNQLSIQNTIYGLGMGGSNAMVGIKTPLGSNPPTANFDINGNARVRSIPRQYDERILTADGDGFINYRPISDFGGGGEPCTWNILNGALGGKNLSMGFSGACNTGFTSIGIDDVGAEGLIPNGYAKLYVYKDKRDKEGFYTMGTVSIAKEESRAVGLYGYGNTKDQGIGVYGMANFVCDELDRKKSNIAVYGGPNKDAYNDCPAPGGFYAGYFAGPLLSINDPIIISDARLKRDIKDIDHPEDLIMKLRPKTYYLNNKAENGYAFSSKKQYGFISQELETVLPELVEEVPGPVTMDEKGNMVPSDKTYKGIAYDGLIALLVKTVQSQDQRISELEAKIKAIDQGTVSTSENAKQTVVLADEKLQQIILDQNVPNPFSERTTIAYKIPANAKDAEIRFYDGSGNLMKAAQLKAKGSGSIEIIGTGVASGVYSYVLYVDGKIMANKKMVKQ